MSRLIEKYNLEVPDQVWKAVQVMENFEYVPGEMPLSSWEIPMSTAFGYLVVVWVLKKIMTNRKPFGLKFFLILHNSFMCVWSFIMALGMGYYLIYDLLEKVNYSPAAYYETLTCDHDQKFTNKGGFYFWVYIFYISKYYELVDTVFICLKKRPLIFLHVYHHFMTLILVWVCLEYKPVAQWVAEFTNAIVHTPMYFYYLLAVLKIKFPGKQMITIGQIIQFIVNNIAHAYAWYEHNLNGKQCSGGDSGANEFGFSVVNSYLILFIMFFIDTYIRPKKQTQGKQQQQQQQQRQKKKKVH